MATGNDWSEKGATDRVEYLDPPKNGNVKTSEYASSDEEKQGDHTTKPPTTARDLVTEILTIEDDPSLNPWTFRMWFIGLGMAVFAG